MAKAKSSPKPKNKALYSRVKAEAKKKMMKGGKAKRTMYKDGGMSKAKPC